ncbi:hypothetical protein F5Y15DRAFT_414531 [Xylariaceae sp. FL0016]|nr:hypothetical protein F5Y15DRAFT_414531 [Xylariaceae sp. FL0016]
MAIPIKTAVITGGASGIGLAVAQALAARGSWDIHLLDINQDAGAAAAASISATFHLVDITHYPSLGLAFQRAYLAHHRLDFVFANAGIAQVGSINTRHDDIGPDVPPPPSSLVLDICLTGALSTLHLALHYFRLSPRDNADRSLCATSSSCGLYPSYHASTYTAAKHGVVGLTRAAAKHLWEDDRVRVNCVLPSIVRTGLMTRDEWTVYPDAMFTPLAKVVATVLMLVDGRDDAPSGETRIDGVVPGKGGVLWGEVVEICGEKHYYREMPKYCDSLMEAVMKGTDVRVLPGEQGEREVSKVIDSGKKDALSSAV